MASGKEGVAVSSHPIVTRVATDILRDGGNAVDAILAASLAQTVVEPHMTTAFGMLSMMHYDRSEEHTSELQSLMRISYAVFCLKNKILMYIQSHNLLTDITHIHFNP